MQVQFKVDFTVKISNEPFALDKDWSVLKVKACNLETSKTAKPPVEQSFFIRPDKVHKSRFVSSLLFPAVFTLTHKTVISCL